MRDCRFDFVPLVCRLPLFVVVNEDVTVVVWPFDVFWYDDCTGWYTVRYAGVAVELLPCDWGSLGGSISRAVVESTVWGDTDGASYAYLGVFGELPPGHCTVCMFEVSSDGVWLWHYFAYSV